MCSPCVRMPAPWLPSSCVNGEAYYIFMILVWSVQWEQSIHCDWNWSWWMNECRNHLHKCTLYPFTDSWTSRFHFFCSFALSSTQHNFRRLLPLGLTFIAYMVFGMIAMKLVSMSVGWGRMTNTNHMYYSTSMNEMWKLIHTMLTAHSYLILLSLCSSSFPLSSQSHVHHSSSYNCCVCFISRVVSLT